MIKFLLQILSQKYTIFRYLKCRLQNSCHFVKASVCKKKPSFSFHSCQESSIKVASETTANTHATLNEMDA